MMMMDDADNVDDDKDADDDKDTDDDTDQMMQLDLTNNNLYWLLVRAKSQLLIQQQKTKSIADRQPC